MNADVIPSSDAGVPVADQAVRDTGKRELGGKGTAAGGH